MLTARRHDHLLGRRDQPATSEESGPGDAILEAACRGLIIEQSGQVRLGGQCL